MMLWNTDALGQKAGSYILSTNQAVDHLDLVTVWVGPTNSGYNIAYLSTPFLAPKGTILNFYIDDGNVAINTASTGSMRDFIWSTNQPLGIGWNVFARVITQTTTSGQAYDRVNTFTHTYSMPGTYDIHPEFTCNSAVYCDVKTITGEQNSI